MSTVGRLAGFVLAGGLSSRMGRDKAHLPLLPPGTVPEEYYYDGRGLEHSAADCSTWINKKLPLAKAPAGKNDFLDAAYGLLSGMVSTCLVSIGKKESSCPYPTIVDKITGRGPCSALATCLEFAKKNGFAAIMVIPCDMPLLAKSCLQDLVAAFEHAPAGTLAIIHKSIKTGIQEMLVGIYAVQALPFFMKALELEKLSLRSILPPDKVLALPYGPELENCFLNCNTPADLGKLRFMQKEGI